MFARTKSPRRYRRDTTTANQNRMNREPTGAIPSIHKGRFPRTSSIDGGRAHSIPGLHFAINERIGLYTVNPISFRLNSITDEVNSVSGIHI